jgi:aspartyl-tRNA(Asn)/glutamyl-tRNA(Gln) amidotransferase subunit B
MGYLKEQKISLTECTVTPQRLGKIVDLVDSGVINNTTAKELFVFVAQTDRDPETIIEEKGN